MRKQRPCLVCAKLRWSEHPGDRIHDNCRTAAENGRAEWPQFTKAERQRMETATKGFDWRDTTFHLPGTLKPKRGRPFGLQKPLPTEAEVAAMTTVQRSLTRKRYRKQGMALPSYLQPMTPRAAAALGTLAAKAKTA
jgi:hypothetical protein